MSTKFNWSCPYCNRDATITDVNYAYELHYFDNDNKDGPLAIKTEIITCPNIECREYIITASLHKTYYQPGLGRQIVNESLTCWPMKPNSLAKQLPNYIPKAIIADYEEACLIKALSPKASATLSRRCLQGIIRDFFGISKDRLVDEVNSIKDKVDPVTWQAIDSVRKIGNIGAHMEKNINLIIDVDPAEAQLLIGLIEILIKDWYIARHDRQKHLESIISIADEKRNEKNNQQTQ